jgi:dTDP-4-dehydrorhamnose reductase
MTIAWYQENVTDGSYWPGYERALAAHPLPVIPCIPMAPSTDKRMLAPATMPDATSPVFLVYGRNGWIGGLLGKLLSADGARWSFGTARLEDRGCLLADIRRVKPTHVLNAAGVTGRPNVDWCESNREETIRTNVIGVLNLVDVCRSSGIHVTNFATGCIYSYDDAHAVGSGKGFTETDAPNFDGSYYSRTKGMVESLLQEYDNLLQLRLRMPISCDLANGRSFVKKIVNYEKVVDIPNSMTVLDELLPASVEMAKRSLTGIYNFTNPGVISHNEVLSLYKEYVDPEYTWSNFTEAEQAKARGGVHYLTRSAAHAARKVY